MVNLWLSAWFIHQRLRANFFLWYADVPPTTDDDGDINNKYMVMYRVGTTLCICNRKISSMSL